MGEHKHGPQRKGKPVQLRQETFLVAREVSEELDRAQQALNERRLAAGRGALGRSDFLADVIVRTGLEAFRAAHEEQEAGERLVKLPHEVAREARRG